MNNLIDRINNEFANIDLTNIESKSNSNYEPFDIVYSVLVHEKLDCVLDFIYNICYFNKSNKILIVIHPNEEIFFQIKNIQLPNFIIINPKPYNKNKYTYSLLKGYIDNFNLISHINFNVYCIIASNCMFVKNVDMKIINEIANDIDNYNQHFTLEYLKINHKDFLKNDELIEFFKKLNIDIKIEFHEGAVYTKKLFQNIIDFIESNNLIPMIKFDFVAEEILLATIENYLTNKIRVRTCKFVNERLPRKKDIDLIIGLKNKFLVKKIPRIINHRARLLVHELYK